MILVHKKNSVDRKFCCIQLRDVEYPLLFALLQQIHTQKNSGYIVVDFDEFQERLHQGFQGLTVQFNEMQEHLRPVQSLEIGSAIHSLLKQYLCTHSQLTTNLQAKLLRIIQTGKVE
ncbi:MAG: hypothetical protein MAGBODY4_01325 [Candidatus Marinimicrobia bacterium]|nr:hypothetical protein [Candidatus Neomarinimicrobiota bacterium]